MRPQLATFLLLLAAGCSHAAAPAPGATGGGGDSGTGSFDGGGGIDAAAACQQYDCSNAVDAVVIPMLVANGFAVTSEDPNVLCRRMSLDLTGIVPAPGECDGKDVGQLADYFMNKTTGINVPDGSPPYVFINRRWWADSFQYQATCGQSFNGNGFTFYPYVLQLDQIVSDLYTGKIGYDVFAQEALASPAFARHFGVFNTNHDLIQIASQAFRVFMGREALPSEAADFGNLWRGWSTTYLTATQGQALYPDCPAAYDGCRHMDVGLDGRQCSGAQALGCESTVLGPGSMVPSNTSAFVPYAQLGPTDLDALLTPGKLISSRPEFAEAAVDRALTKYLGWWKAGWYRPDYDVPAVRDALVAFFVANHFDIRPLEREIVTSILYRQAAVLQPNESPDVPIWAVGPTKLFYAEAWLDSLALALDPSAHAVGGCDFRYNQQMTNDQHLPGYFTFPDATYPATANELGGCPKASVHSDMSGLVVALSRRTLLAQKCMGAFASQSSLDGLVDVGFTGIGRPPTAAEKSGIEARMTADDGCPGGTGCDFTKLGYGFCTSLFASSLDTFY